jgi:dTDP-glucose pyrophosphorylase
MSEYEITSYLQQCLKEGYKKENWTVKCVVECHKAASLLALNNAAALSITNLVELDLITQNEIKEDMIPWIREKQKNEERTI